jgi:hypothetical protein
MTHLGLALGIRYSRVPGASSIVRYRTIFETASSRRAGLFGVQFFNMQFWRALLTFSQLT